MQKIFDKIKSNPNCYYYIFHSLHLGPSGYLSIVDWPLLPFYGVMCGIYVCMGIGWLVVSAMHWRDLLRIQFWIGGVIFLGNLIRARIGGEPNFGYNGPPLLACSLIIYTYI